MLEDLLKDHGYDIEKMEKLDSVYDSAVIGVTYEGKLVYDYSVMIDMIQAKLTSYQDAEDVVTACMSRIKESDTSPIIMFELNR